MGVGCALYPSLDGSRLEGLGVYSPSSWPGSPYQAWEPSVCRGGLCHATLRQGAARFGW